MKKRFFCLLLPFFVFPLFAQEKTDLTRVDLQEYKPILLPVKAHSVYPDQELVVKLTGYNHKGTDLKFSFTWSLGGEMDQKKKEFKWTPTENDIGIHPIIFTAIDTFTNQQVSQPAIITVKARQYRPTLEIKSNRPLPDGFLVLDEGDDLALVVQANDRNPTDRLTLGYYVNNDHGKKFGNAKFEVNDKVAIFLWSPNDTQAKEKTLNLTFFVEDQTGLRAEKTVPVFVNDIVHIPVFKNKTREYFIDEGEILSFNVYATDDDREKITYKILSTDIKQNDYYFDGNTGKFQWKPTFEYARQKTDYRLIFSASDQSHTVYDTIGIKVDPKNYPPEIEPVRDREIKENEELVIRLVVNDKNGDENLKVSVVESDFDGYRFDPRTRVFRWTPPFSFVNRSGKRRVQVKFRVTDTVTDAFTVAKITVLDREDPREILISYSKSLASAKKLSGEIGVMEANLKYTLERKRYWNTVFDISTIVVGALTGIASSPIASDKLRESAIPIAGAATTLFGIRAVIDKSSDKISDLKNKVMILKGNVDLSINSIIRDYSETPSLTTTDSFSFKQDFADFKQKITEFEAQNEKLKTEYSGLSVKEKK